MKGSTRRRAMTAGPRGFYPAEAGALRATLGRLFADAEAPPVGPQPRVLVVPHAGYYYSGATAARAYGRILGCRYDRVIVIGPSHYSMFPGASVYDGDLYETPLGDVPVDRDLVEELLDQRRSVRFVAEAEKREHSVEVQVPFLQHALAQFEMVPMLVYDTSFANCERVASDLAAACHRFPRQTLIVASSDLYHGPGSREAREASLRTARALEEESARAFSDGVDQGRYQACGSGPITIAKLIAERHGCGRPEVVQVTTSHEVARGSEDYVVGYLGAVVR